MTTTLYHPRFQLRGCQSLRDSFAQDVARGLSRRPKELHCRYFYDEEGSRLFEAICQQPEYYLTRAEREILAVQAPRIAAQCEPGTVIVELGSGSAVKTRLLLEAFLQRDHPVTYVPIDISQTMLIDSSDQLLHDYPTLRVEGICGEYNYGLRFLPQHFHQPKLILWLGSNVGNLHRAEASHFLADIGSAMASADRLLLGVDLLKEADVLEQAYDDRAGFTARFNLNILGRINRELKGDFAIQNFAHRSLFNAELGRVEMHLDSLRAQCVHIGGSRFEFARGESIHTENSYKYSPAQIQELATRAHLSIEKQWTDKGGRFALVCLAKES